MITFTYEYKLIPTPEQADLIDHVLEVCRKVWNFALRERKDWSASRKCPINACSLVGEYIMPPDAPYPNYHKQAKSLTTAKTTNPELGSVNAQVLQQVLRTLDRAFEDMKTRGLGFPRFKKWGRQRSFVFPQMLKTPMVGDTVKLPQLGIVKLRLSRPIPEGFEIKQARIVKRASGYFVMLSLQADVTIPSALIHGHPVGVDVGLESFFATSDGELVPRPKFFKSMHRQLELLQRRLKRKKLGSNNRRKLNQKIARVHERISDTRKDFHFKSAHHLCDQAGMVFVEDLDFRIMAKGMLGKHTLDAGFGQFLNQILPWVCWKREVHFGKVNPNGTSQTCPNCEAHTGKKELSERVHHCPECGYTTNRDVAAGQVIRNRGISALGHSVDETVCGGVLAGAAMSSQVPVKQKPKS